MGIYYHIWANFLNKENKVYKKILTVLLLTGIAFSQQKIGIVFSEKIRLDFEEFKDCLLYTSDAADD